MIGLTTIDTPTTTDAFSTGKFPQYKFLDYLDLVVEESAKLRREGANAVVITAHVGNFC